MRHRALLIYRHRREQLAVGLTSLTHIDHGQEIRTLRVLITHPDVEIARRPASGFGIRIVACAPAAAREVDTDNQPETCK